MAEQRRFKKENTEQSRGTAVLALPAVREENPEVELIAQRIGVHSNLRAM